MKSLDAGCNILGEKGRDIFSTFLIFASFSSQKNKKVSTYLVFATAMSRTWSMWDRSVSSHRSGRVLVRFFFASVISLRVNLAYVLSHPWKIFCFSYIRLYEYNLTVWVYFLSIGLVIEGKINWSILLTIVPGLLGLNCTDCALACIWSIYLADSIPFATNVFIGTAGALGVKTV